MSIKRRLSGAWVVAVTKRRLSGAWVTVATIKRMVSGAWVVVQSGTLTASFNPDPVSDSLPNGTAHSVACTITPAGGVGPYTYAWSWLSGGATITINNGTTATATFTAAGATNLEKTGTAKCIVTDTGNAGNSITPTVVVDFINGTA